jgi:hypothetical protein
MRRSAQAGVGTVANETPQRLRKICDTAASGLLARRLVIAFKNTPISSCGHNASGL